jgi:hypothetical protein
VTCPTCTTLAGRVTHAESRRDEAEAQTALIRNAATEWVDARAALHRAQTVNPDNTASAAARYEQAQQILRGVTLMLKDIGASTDIVLVSRHALNRRDHKLAAQLANETPKDPDQ